MRGKKSGFGVDRDFVRSEDNKRILVGQAQGPMSRVRTGSRSNGAVAKVWTGLAGKRPDCRPFVRECQFRWIFGRNP